MRAPSWREVSTLLADQREQFVFRHLVFGNDLDFLGVRRFPGVLGAWEAFRFFPFANGLMGDTQFTRERAQADDFYCFGDGVYGGHDAKNSTDSYL